MPLTKEQKNNNIIAQLKHSLIASCQPVEGGPMDSVEHVVAMAMASVNGGAKGLRIKGLKNVRAVSAVTEIPIVGIVKKDLVDSQIRITPYRKDVIALSEAGACVIAFDATDRERPTPAQDILESIHESGCIAMADCSSYQEGKRMADLGCTFIGSTMSGYIDLTSTPKDPDLDVVARWAAEGILVIAEGRYNSPSLAAQAIKAGAWAVTVGSAITRVEHIAEWFVDSISKAVTHDLQ